MLNTNNAKKVIAVDLDDVLSASTPAMIAFSNERWGMNLTLEHYTEHLTEMWQVDEAEAIRRVTDFIESGANSTYDHYPEAAPVLRRLAKRYTLVILTSRRKVVREETLVWLDKYFKGIFSEVRFTGFFDDAPGFHLTKAELCREIGASYLIDDHLKHSLAAAEAGIPSILYGEYPWNQATQLPANVIRCQNWAEIGEYFSAKRG